MKLTILIPTYNRPEWLKRSIHYLLQYSMNYQVHILDGGNESSKNLNSSFIKELNNPAITITGYNSDLNLGLRLLEGLKKVTTSYVLIWPDDDFLVPRHLDEIMNFMDRNPDYSAGIGKVLCLVRANKLKAILPKSSYFLIDHLRHSPSMVDPAILRRIISYNLITRQGGLPLYYSLRRTSQLRASFEHMRQETRYSIMELMMNTLCLIDGKVKSFDFFFGFRNYSSKATDCLLREGDQSYFPDDQLLIVREIVAKKLVECSGYSEQNAFYAFDEIITIPYKGDDYTYCEGMPLEKVYRFYNLYKNAQIILAFLGFNWVGRVFGTNEDDFKILKKILSKY